LKTDTELYQEMDELIEFIEGEDAKEEVDIEFVPYKNNMKLLLDAQDLDTYLKSYDDICKSETGVLECFDIVDAEELKEHIEKNNIAFDELKTETINATCEALKNVIYEAEEDEY